MFPQPIVCPSCIWFCFGGTVDGTWGGVERGDMLSYGCERFLSFVDCEYACSWCALCGWCVQPSYYWYLIVFLAMRGGAHNFIFLLTLREVNVENEISPPL